MSKICADGDYSVIACFDARMDNENHMYWSLALVHKMKITPPKDCAG
jgi:hypothetical protein